MECLAVFLKGAPCPSPRNLLHEGFGLIPSPRTRPSRFCRQHDILKGVFSLLANTGERAEADLLVHARKLL